MPSTPAASSSATSTAPGPPAGSTGPSSTRASRSPTSMLWLEPAPRSRCRSTAPSSQRPGARRRQPVARPLQRSAAGRAAAAAEVLPLADTQEVGLASTVVILLSAPPGHGLCWPGPVEMATTPALLHPTPAIPPTGGPPAESAGGPRRLPPRSCGCGLRAGAGDRTTASPSTATSRQLPDRRVGSLWLRLLEQRLVGPAAPAGARPTVSGIDQVALDQAGTVVRVPAASASPASPRSHRHPSSTADLALPPEAGIAGGDVTWMVYDSGDEQLLFGAVRSRARFRGPAHGRRAQPRRHTPSTSGRTVPRLRLQPGGDWQLTLPAAIGPSRDRPGQLLVGWPGPCSRAASPIPADRRRAGAASTAIARCSARRATCPRPATVIWRRGRRLRGALHLGLLPRRGHRYELVVDGFSLGTFTADSWDTSPPPSPRRR